MHIPTMAPKAWKKSPLPCYTIKMDFSAAQKAVKTLLKTDKPEEALRLALAIRQKSPIGDTRPHKLIEKCKIALLKKEKNLRKNFIKQGLITIRALKKAKDYEKTLKACKELLAVDPENGPARRLHHKVGVIYIEQQLHEPIRTRWERAGEWEKLYTFYQKLILVFPEYKKLRTLLKEAEEKLMEKDREQKKAFAEDSLNQLQKWYDEGKFEEVIQGAKELIAFTHQGSGDAKILLRNAERANRRQIEKETEAYLEKNAPLLKAAWESKQPGFIKL